MPETTDPQSLKERLTPTHLLEPPPPVIPSDDDMKKRVESASVPEVPKPEHDGPDPRGEKQYTFTIEYKDARGKIWKGQFTSKILTIHERQQMGVMKSMFGGGQPLNSIDPLPNELNYCLAHMAFSLTKRPDWAENLRALEDPGLVQAIFAEVDSHESYFLGWEPTQGESAEKSG